MSRESDPLPHSIERRMRLRSSPLMRDLVNETQWTASQLIQPLFVGEGLSADLEIPGLLGTKRQTEENLLRQVEIDLKAGVRQFILFSIPEEKRERAFNHAFSQRVISRLKKQFGSECLLWLDTCLCSVTTHGHCCVFSKDTTARGNGISSEETRHEIATIALAYAEAGADGLSPSDMMDGRVAAIRSRLDENGFQDTPIMSYSTKFASSMYGPFRVAADSSPKMGDRKGYQIDVRNRTDALASSLRCAEEGADLLMVKPGMTSIDLIRDIHSMTGKPVGAYQVSGEFAALVFLAEKGLTSLPEAMKESWHVFRRAGAQYIITYGARYAREWGMNL
jgi:porphobilinogen synthase